MMKETIEQLEAGLSAYRKMKRRRRNLNVGVASNDGGSLEGAHNLVDEVPNEAMKLWREKPEFRSDTTTDPYETIGISELVDQLERTFDPRSDDLAELITEAANRGKILDIGSGEYQMKKGVATGPMDNNDAVIVDSDSTIAGVIGDGPDNTTIYYSGTNVSHLFELHGIPYGVLQGIEFNITKQPTNSEYRTDVGIINSYFSKRFWGQDVRLRGERARLQDLNGDGDWKRIGGYYSWHVDASDPDAKAFSHRIELPDGCRYEPSKGEHHQQSIPFSTEQTHEGLSVYKECVCIDHVSNGFYVSYDPTKNPEPAKARNGETVLWDCTAKNSAAGNMRIGYNDTIVGGEVACHNEPHATEDSTGLVHGMGDGAKVVGLRIDATEFGAEAIQVRTKSKGLKLARVVLKTGDDPDNSRPVRLSSATSGKGAPWNTQITIEDCYWYDGDPDRDSATVVIKRADVTANNWHVLSEAANSEVYVDPVEGPGTGDSASLTLDGESIGHGTHDASKLRMDDPRPLPEYGFPDEY